MVQLAVDALERIDWTGNGWRNNKNSAGREKTGPYPTDHGKGGVKRSVLTEARGIPMALADYGANRA